MNKSVSFSLEKTSKVDFSIHRTSFYADSPMNQNEIHIHKECEIYVYLDGDVSFEVENRIYPISRGCVIVTRPYEYHRCIYRSSKLHRHYWMTFSAEGNEEYLKAFFGREKGQDNLILLDEEDLNELFHIFEELLNGESHGLKRRIRFLQILDMIDRGRRAQYWDYISDMPEDVKKAFRYMDEHLIEPINVKTLASIANVSTNTLERHFMEYFDTSPMAMLKKKRLIEAARYLRNGESVSEAALKSGFEDYSNFIQLFKKQFGITPLKYKKSILDE